MQVSFIIPVYNQLAFTQACLDSLREHVPADIAHEIILVDDGSDQATKDFLASLTAPHRVVSLPGNHGFARATNAGAELATGQWLCLLNNDVELTAGALPAMLAVRDAHADAGIIGNIQVTTRTGEVDHAGIEFRDGGYPRHIRGDLATRQAAGAIVPALAVTAACCLVDRAWFLAVGGLDARYTNGFEDVDLCLRARENGWRIYVATGSVVKHAVSTSQGRGDHEFRNARSFLERWGPRTAALEAAALREAARRHQAARARATAGQTAPRAVQSARLAALAAEAQAAEQARTPVTVWVDLLRMEPGGANGGIKPLVYAMLAELTRLSWEPQRYVVLARESLLPELTFLRASDAIATQDAGGWRVRSGDRAAPASTTPNALAQSHPPDVLYCPFGTSAFARPDLPSVALLVDSLHRDLPAALPIEEVNFREDNFKRVIGSATWLQTLAHHGIARLQAHWDVHPSRCFHTYAPVQKRLVAPDPLPPPPSGLPEKNYFLYPANYWAHKNHETLLTAYRLYRHKVGTDAAWSLVLTGHADSRQQTLREMSAALGLDGAVHFAGHLPDDAFAALWRRASALVFPSLHEGFGIPLLEAFELSLPVLASDASVLPEVGGDACHWFDASDPRAIADALATVAGDSELRAQLTAAGTRRLRHFSLHTETCRLNHFLHAAARGLVP